MKVHDSYTFLPADVDAVLDDLRSLDDPPSTITVRLATDRISTLKEHRDTPLHLHAIDLHHVSRLLAREGSSAIVAGEGTDSVLPYSYTPADPDDLIRHTPEQILEIHRLQTSHMTDEERALKSFHRKNLKRLKNWDEWDAAHDKQLNAHFDAGTIGRKVP